MDLFTYLLGKKGQNTQRDLFSYLLGKGAGGSGTYVNFTGTSLNISNTLRARIKNITLKGATSQYTTTGKNLFNATIGQGAILSPEGTDGPDNYDIRLRTNRFFLPAGDYIFSCGQSNIEIVLYYFSGPTGNAYSADTSWNTTLNFTLTQDCYIRIMFRKSDNSTIVPTYITNPMIRLASVTDDTYEPYTGGQPSPSPSYPQPIKVVTGEQNVNVSGKNLFDKNLLPSTWSSIVVNMITLNVEPNTKYTMSSNIPYGGNVANLFLYDESGTGSTATNGVKDGKNVTVTSSSTGIIKVGYRSNSATTITRDDYWYQLEKGSTATSYTPYYSKDYPLSLGTLELAKIGNYQDYIYGTPNNWYKYKYIGKQIYDGSENWQKSSSTGSLVFRLLLAQAKAYKSINVLSNYFTSAGDTEISNNQVKNRYSNFYNIEFRYDTITTVSDWKTWLSTHNVVLYYILVEPTTEQITDTTLIEQLNNLYNATSQEGTTYITCSSASDSNEIIVFSGDIKVASVGLGNPLNTSLLSSNIQEEPNLDDVNETEDIEQNEEPIEEEVS